MSEYHIRNVIVDVKICSNVEQLCSLAQIDVLYAGCPDQKVGRGEG